MEQNITLEPEPIDFKELGVWLSQNDILLRLSEEELQGVCSTLCAHDKHIVIFNDQLYLDQENWMMDELIDMACEYNYEDLMQLKDSLCENNSGKNDMAYIKAIDSITVLEKREIQLTSAFEKTVYGQQVKHYEPQASVFHQHENIKERRK